MPKQPHDLCEQAQRLVEQGDGETALTYLDEALQKQPDNWQLWFLKGVAFGLAGRHADALPCFEQCTQVYPQIFTGWYHKGVALAALGERTQAIECYRRARSLDPTDSSSAFNLGIELFQSGAYPEALEQLWDASTLGHPRAAEVMRACQQLIESENQK